MGDYPEINTIKELDSKQDSINFINQKDKDEDKNNYEYHIVNTENSNFICKEESMERENKLNKIYNTGKILLFLKKSF